MRTRGLQEAARARNQAGLGLVVGQLRRYRSHARHRKSRDLSARLLRIVQLLDGFRNRGIAQLRYHLGIRIGADDNPPKAARGFFELIEKYRFAHPARTADQQGALHGAHATQEPIVKRADFKFAPGQLHRRRAKTGTKRILIRNHFARPSF